MITLEQKYLYVVLKGFYLSKTFQKGKYFNLERYAICNYFVERWDCFCYGKSSLPPAHWKKHFWFCYTVSTYFSCFNRDAHIWDPSQNWKERCVLRKIIFVLVISLFEVFVEHHTNSPLGYCWLEKIRAADWYLCREEYYGSKKCI